MIVAGQLLIVSFGGDMFHVQIMSVKDWVYIIFGTLPVFVIGEAMRAIKKLIS